MMRELTEEVESGAAYGACLGFINDDRTPVGSVHLASFTCSSWKRPRPMSREAALADAGFAPLAELLARPSSSRRGRSSCWRKLRTARSTGHFSTLPSDSSRSLHRQSPALRRLFQHLCG